MSVISPKEILKKKIVKGCLNEEEQLQPNSIDLTICDAKLILDGGILSKNSKNIYVANEAPFKMGKFEFEGNRAYDITFNEFVDVPDDTVAFITHRSTLARIGGCIISGLYDSSFKNQLGAILRTNNKLSIERDARIATIFFVTAKMAKRYSGSYQSKERLEELNK